MRFTDIRARITEGMKFKEYIMLVSETDKKGVFAYEEVQPLVRCKDCQFRAKEERIQKGKVRYFCKVHKRLTDLDKFCAWGERVEGSEDETS